jgi:alginate O-acetyltransferase complex protein AlgJ
MLKLPADALANSPQRVTIQQVTSGNALWRPSRDADVLLLGDSFTNIFSLEALGWGESAGFAEHLSLALGGRPLDCILRNSDAAFATREMLASELARGRDRLAGKKLVIWEFAVRELAFGNWKMIDLKLGEAKPSQFFVPNAGEPLEVSGIVEAVSSVPRPGTVPYADHVMAVHLTDLKSPSSQTANAAQSLVYLMSMRENVWTPAARLRPGDRITMRLRAWSDVSAQYEQINRSELDDPELQLEEPSWGELIAR